MKIFSSLLVCTLYVATAHAVETMNRDTTQPARKTFMINGVNKNLLLQLINDVRKKGCQCGDTYYYPAPALTWNDKLEEAAQVHSEDMFQNKYFSHISADGKRAGDRMEKAGYHWLMFAENIGLGYKAEKDMVDGWLKSPGHCRNIMNKSYREMGAARVGNYWTQTFGTK